MLVGFWWYLLAFLGLGPHHSHLSPWFHITSPSCVWNSSSASLIRRKSICASCDSFSWPIPIPWDGLPISRLWIMLAEAIFPDFWVCVSACVDNYLLLFRQCSVELSLLEGLDPLLRNGEEWPSAVTLLLMTLSQSTSSSALGCHHLHSDLESPQVTAHCLLPNRQSRLNSQLCEPQSTQPYRAQSQEPLSSVNVFSGCWTLDCWGSLMPESL